MSSLRPFQNWADRRHFIFVLDVTLSSLLSVSNPPVIEKGRFEENRFCLRFGLSQIRPLLKKGVWKKTGFVFVVTLSLIWSVFESATCSLTTNPQFCHSMLPKGAGIILHTQNICGCLCAVDKSYLWYLCLFNFVADKILYYFLEIESINCDINVGGQNVSKTYSLELFVFIFEKCNALIFCTVSFFKDICKHFVKKKHSSEVVRQSDMAAANLNGDTVNNALSRMRLDDSPQYVPLLREDAPQNMLPTNSLNQQHYVNLERENVGLGSSSTNFSQASRRQSAATPSTSHMSRASSASSLASQSHSSNHPIYNWQATKTTVKERFAFLFNNEILCDVHFIVGRDTQQQRIPAHKFVLSVGSAVFDAMFNGTLATRSEEIELPDVEPAAFLALLRFLYSDEVQIGPETVMTTLYTAKKYAVPALEKHCVDFLKSNLGSDNAFMLLTQARLFDEPQLAALCLETIDKNTAEALAADGFTDIDLDTLSVVLERDTLRIREAKLFQAVVRWSEAECNRQQIPVVPENQRAVLGRALSLVRFPLMSVEEFAVGAAQCGILMDREIVSLFLYFTVNPKPEVPFLEVPRCCMTGKEQTVKRFQQIESRWGYSGTSDRVRFIVDRRIFVVGFGLYGSIHGPTEYDVNLQVIHTATGKVCGNNNTSFSCDGSNYTFRVMFKEPVEIMPNTSYTASATLKGPDSHYGTKGLRKVNLDLPSGGKVMFQFSYAAGNNNGTSVEDGQIPEIIFYT